MQNTLSVSVRLIFSASVLSVLSACGGGGGSSDNNPPPAPVEVNTPPVLESIGPQSIAVTETLNFTVTATDADATTPDLTATGLPAGATFNPANGTFNWVPAVSDAAGIPYSVTFTAADEVDQTLTATETVEITVTTVPVTADCTVAVASPAAGSLQAAGDPGVQAPTATLEVEATFSCLPNIPAGWGVKISAVGANGGTGEEIVTSGPFIANITGLEKGVYSVTATVVNDAGADVSGAATVATVSDVGLGDYYIAIGDSITFGVGDDIDTDDASTDGRNTGGGYTPVLNNLLTAALQYPHTVVAVGVEGTSSAGGATDVAGALADHPDAQRVLINYGMNDAGPPFLDSVPSGLGLPATDPNYAGTFKANMQQIIDQVVALGKEALIAKINVAAGDSANSGRYDDPEAPDAQRNVNIKEYNSVIANELNGVTIAGPDLYAFFLINDRFRVGRQYSDFIHPNGVGYLSIASLWCEQLVPAAVIASCTSTGN